ncbi:MAG: hypothetical protein IPM66_00355 [Acidobacteriota bacterium]|nr:MAG: hypothetical protein IPM66_00355 [Acidobacteriota bacterium]
MNAQRSTEIAGGGYRSRYLAFLKQRHPSKDDRSSKTILGFSQGFINVAIFLGLVLAILTLFGFGLSRLTSQQTTIQRSQAPTESTSMQVKEGGLIVPPTVFPSGHAVIAAPSPRKTAATGAAVVKSHRN